MTERVNRLAVVRADLAFYAQYPELRGRKLTAGPEDAELRKMWLDHYEQASANISKPGQPKVVPKPLTRAQLAPKALQPCFYNLKTPMSNFQESNFNVAHSTPKTIRPVKLELITPKAQSLALVLDERAFSVSNSTPMFVRPAEGNSIKPEISVEIGQNFAEEFFFQTLSQSKNANLGPVSDIASITQTVYGLTDALMENDLAIKEKKTEQAVRHAAYFSGSFFAGGVLYNGLFGHAAAKTVVFGVAVASLPVIAKVAIIATVAVGVGYATKIVWDKLFAPKIFKN